MGEEEGGNYENLSLLFCLSLSLYLSLSVTLSLFPLSLSLYFEGREQMEQERNR